MFYISPFCYICKSFTRKLIKSKYTDNGTTKILEQLQFCGIENDFISRDIPVSICYKCSKILDFISKFKKMFIESNKIVHRYVLKLKDPDAEFNYNRLCVVLNAKDAIVTPKKSRNLKQNIKVPRNISSKICTNIDITENNTTNLKSSLNINVGTTENVTKEVNYYVDLTEQHKMPPNKSKTDVHKNSTNFKNNIDAINDKRSDEKRENVTKLHDNIQVDKTDQLIKLDNLRKCVQHQLTKYTSPILKSKKKLTHSPSVTVTRNLRSKNCENNQLKNKDSGKRKRTDLSQPVTQNVIAEFSVEQILINQDIWTQDNIDNASNSKERIKSKLPDSHSNTETIVIKEEERKEGLINVENVVQNSPTNISAPILAESKMEQTLIKQENQLCTENNINNHNIDISCLLESRNLTFQNTTANDTTSTIQMQPAECSNNKIQSSNNINPTIAKNNDDNVHTNLVSAMKHKLITILNHSEPQIFSDYEDTDGTSNPEVINVDMEQIQNTNSEQSIEQSVNHANKESTDASNTKEHFIHKCSFCKGTFQEPSMFAQHLLSCKFEKRFGWHKQYNEDEDINEIDENTIMCIL